MKLRLRELRKRAKMTQTQVAHALGVRDHTNISRWENGERDIPVEYLAPLSRLLNASADEIINNEINKNPVAELKRISQPVPQFGTDSVPIYGRVNGASEAVMLNFDEVIGEAIRHPNQQGMKDSFAMYVNGDSMSPRYKSGELVYAIANRQPLAGQDCIIECNDSGSFVKEFIRKTDKEIICRQYSPAREWRKKLNEVKAVHAVVGRG